MKATVKLILRNDYKTKDGKQQLSLRYTAKRKSTHINIGISIHPKCWDEKALLVKLREPFSQKYNVIITEMYQRAVNLMLDNFGNPLCTKEYKQQLANVVSTTESTSFYEFFDTEIEVLKTDRTEGTISNYKKLINTMKLWKPILEFKEITLDFIEQFHKHELDEGNLESTVNKKHANFKFLIGRAVLKEKMEQNPYVKFTIKKKIEAQNNDVLTEAEITKLHDVYTQNIYTAGKQKVLRTFLFSCYTGLSYAEFHVVTFANIKKVMIDKNSYLLLSNKRVKNNETYRIPIVSDKVVKLLGTGKDFQKIFNPLQNQPTNRYLATIMAEQGIDKKITFHRARHSFRTIVANKGIQESFAERMMGHAEGNDIKEIYTHLADEDLVREMLEKWKF